MFYDIDFDFEGDSLLAFYAYFMKMYNWFLISMTYDIAWRTSGNIFTKCLFSTISKGQ